MKLILKLINEAKEIFQLNIKKDGIDFIDTKLPNFNCIFEFFNPLNDEQIKMLEQDYNNLYGTNIEFPCWYKEFLKISNGMNLYFGCLCFYGDQTHLIKTNAGYTRKLIERNNPNWMAPYSLLTNGSIKNDISCKNRWFTFAGFKDETLVAYDFKNNKFVRMKKDPINLSINKWRKMTEVDYEKNIIHEWDSLDEFLEDSLGMLKKIYYEWLNDTIIMQLDGFDRQIELWGKIT